MIQITITHAMTKMLGSHQRKYKSKKKVLRDNWRLLVISKHILLLCLRKFEKSSKTDKKKKNKNWKRNIFLMNSMKIIWTVILSALLSSKLWFLNISIYWRKDWALFKTNSKTTKLWGKKYSVRVRLLRDWSFW